MKRIHLFELEDLKWFPSFLRNYGTDFLRFLANKTEIYKPVIPIIQRGIESNGVNQIVDLASGGGGGLLWINEELKRSIPNLTILLTDYYPNIDAFEYMNKESKIFVYSETPVDARNVTDNLKGLRTQFLSFHHFKPEDAKKILQNSVNSGNPIAIFEVQERSARSLITMFFLPLIVMLATPLIRPFKIGRFFFTYIIPIVPLFVLWDGIVSSLRTYTREEMEGMVAELEKKESFNWEFGRVKSGPVSILYMLGTLKRD